MKLSRKDYIGYDLIKELGLSLGKKPSPGYIYPLLISLKHKGFIKDRKIKNKKLYSITKSGRKFLKELLEKRQETIRSMINTFKPLLDRGEAKILMNIVNKFKENSSISKDYDLFERLRYEVGILLNTDYDKKRTAFKDIMENTINKLKNLNEQ